MLGALVGALVTYWLAMKIADKQFAHLREISKIDAWHSAAREFISALAPDVATLERDCEGDLMDFLRAAHGRHSASVAVFEWYLSPPRRESFRAAWQAHCYGTCEDGTPDSPERAEMDHDDLLYLHYSREANLADIGTPRAIALQRMHQLIACAREV
jgi:hypothetical protein